jgi:hypothetical protein
VVVASAEVTPSEVVDGLANLVAKSLVAAREALRKFDRLGNATRMDNLLKREILVELMHDPAMSIAERDKFDQQYKETFAARSPFTEFDFE